MTEFPFRPFSEIEILPLADLGASLQRLKEMFAAMAGAPARPDALSGGDPTRQVSPKQGARP